MSAWFSGALKLPEIWDSTVATGRTGDDINFLQRTAHDLKQKATDLRLEAPPPLVPLQSAFPL